MTGRENRLLILALGAMFFSAQAAQEQAKFLLQQTFALEQRGAVELELQPIQIWSDDAVIGLHYPDGRVVNRSPEPVQRWLGRIAGESGSRVMISRRADGKFRGLVSSGEQYWILPWTGPDRAATFSRLNQTHFEQLQEHQDFSCHTKEPPSDPDAALPMPLPTLSVAVSSRSHSYTARVALETDAQYLHRFGGNISEAVTYAGDLFAFISGIYEHEVATSLSLTYLSLWPEGHPWLHDSVSCALRETGGFWNTHRQDVDRTIMHYISGRNMGGGIAWLGVLCQGAFSSGPGDCNILPAPGGQYGGAYGVSAGITGGFDPDNPGAVWDLKVIAHEIGHNFNSRHTHCYGGIGGVAETVDECWNREGSPPVCHDGPEVLPGPSGQQSGTIMSYCHQQFGGMSNIAPSLGLGHSYGISPERVPARMLNHVQFWAQQFPTCLAPLEGYQLSVSPREPLICTSVEEQPTARLDLLVYTSGGLDEPVSLQFQSTEAGISGDLAPAIVDPPGATVLTVTTEESMPSGNYLIDILSSSGGLTADLAIDLKVASSLDLASPQLLGPGADDIAQVIGMPLNWEAVDDASGYRIQVASDADFNNIVADFEVTGSNEALIPEGLEPGARYYWRVASMGVCGTGDFSEAQSFGMAHAVCLQVDQDIPDGDPAGLDSILALTDNGMIREMKFSIRVQHTWVGDLSATLTAPDGSSSILLFDRPGLPGSVWGCPEDDIVAVLDDPAPDDVQLACNNIAPAISGWLSPLESLAAFNGMDLAGDWTLNISDADAPYSGVLIEWCLLPGLVDDNGLPLFRDRFEVAVDNG